MELISVIIPIYNTAAYLDRCVESVRKQTYNNIEILLVDDGSTDASGEMCDNFAKEDSRIRVFRKENGGQGSARNLGLDNAKGEYISFVDSDDFMSEDMYEKLISDIRQYDADIAACSSTTGYDTVGSDKTKIYRGDEIMAGHLDDSNLGLGQSPCNKLFKKEIFDGVRFVTLRAYEDCASIHKFLSKANTVVYRDLSLYHYIPRENSTITQPFSAVKFRQLDAYSIMYRDYAEKYPGYAHLVKRKFVGSCQYCIGESYKTGMQKALADEIKAARKELKAVGKDGLTFKMRLSRALMMHFTYAFALLYKYIR